MSEEDFKILSNLFFSILSQSNNKGIDPRQALMIAENQVKQSFFGEDDLVTDEVPMRDSDDLGKLQVILGVREFPMRVKCATLAWHTLNVALKDLSTIATTE